MGTDLLSCREGSSVEQRWLLVSPIKSEDSENWGRSHEVDATLRAFGGNHDEFSSISWNKYVRTNAEYAKHIIQTSFPKEVRNKSLMGPNKSRR
jgi:hypothetical protein